MNSNNDKSSEELIRNQVTEELKYLLIESLPPTHPSVAELNTEPQGQLSSHTIDLLHDVITTKHVNAIERKLTTWCKEEYDYLEYSEYEKKYALAQKDRLINILNTRD